MVIVTVIVLGVLIEYIVIIITIIIPVTIIITITIIITANDQVVGKYIKLLIATPCNGYL